MLFSDLETSGASMRGAADEAVAQPACPIVTVSRRIWTLKAVALSGVAA